MKYKATIVFEVESRTVGWAKRRLESHRPEPVLQGGTGRAAH
jgi:hypothetical protein